MNRRRWVWAAMLTLGAGLGAGGAMGQPADEPAEAPADAPVQAEARAPQAPSDPAEAPVEAEDARRVEAPYLGLAAMPTNPEARAQLKLGEGVGLTVVDVAEDSPAAEAGIQRLDVLHRLDDQILVNQQQLGTLIRLRGTGQEVTLHLFRAGEAKDLTVTIGKTQRLVRRGAWRRQIRFAPDGVEVVPMDPRRGGRDRWVQHDPDADAAWEQMEQQIIRLRRELGENEALGDAQRRQFERALEAMRQRLAAGRAGAVAGGNLTHAMRINDGEHDIEIRTTDGDKHLKVTDAAGNLVFEGPINTEAQRAQVPAEVMEKIEKFENRARVEIRIHRLDPAPGIVPGIAPGNDSEEPDEPGPHTLN